MANIDDPSTVQIVSKSDYAGNGGDNYSGYPDYGPGKGSANNVYSNGNTYKWPMYSNPYPTPNSNSGATFGVFYEHGFIKLKDIKVGTAHLYMAGEKYLNPDHYLDSDTDDDQPWSQGMDVDTVRWVYPAAPQRDRRGVVNYGAFGSCHPGSFNMLFCDGAVHSISYDIVPDPTKVSPDNPHRALGNRIGKYLDSTKTGGWAILPIVDASQYQ